MTFREALTEQRWDDHRFYHHSRINQSLHLLSALSFIVAYGLLLVAPVVSVLIAWLFAMPSRQLGHFFFEPRGYDHANQATHEHKEEVKVGYNLQRKVILMTIWVLSPLVLLLDPAVRAAGVAGANWSAIVSNIAYIWLIVGAGAVVGRTVQLCVIRDVQAGLVWCTKILTDPFHDVMLYGKSPLYLLRGELFDPIISEDAA